MYTTILPYQKLGYFPTIWKQNWSHQNIAGYTLMFNVQCYHWFYKVCNPVATADTSNNKPLRKKHHVIVAEYSSIAFGKSTEGELGLGPTFKSSSKPDKMNSVEGLKMLKVSRIISYQISRFANNIIQL